MNREPGASRSNSGLEDDLLPGLRSIDRSITAPPLSDVTDEETHLPHIPMGRQPRSHFGCGARRLAGPAKKSWHGPSIPTSPGYAGALFVALRVPGSTSDAKGAVRSGQREMCQGDHADKVLRRQVGCGLLPWHASSDGVFKPRRNTLNKCPYVAGSWRHIGGIIRCTKAFKDIRDPGRLVRTTKLGKPILKLAHID